MKIRSTNDDSIGKAKILTYGPPGVGKTTLATTIKGTVLIISSEAGLLSIKGSNIDVIDITIDDNDKPMPKEQRIAKLGEIFKYLNTDEAKEKYDWLFIDSLTELAENMVEALYKEFPDRKDSLVLYGENSKRMRALIKAFRDLPHYNVVFTALPTIEKDENARRYTSVSMVGKIAQKIPAFFDEVFYMQAIHDAETDETKRFLTTQPTADLVCKDRSGKLDRYEPADLDYIHKKINA